MKHCVCNSDCEVRIYFEKYRFQTLIIILMMISYTLVVLLQSNNTRVTIQLWFTRASTKIVQMISVNPLIWTRIKN